MTQCWSRFQVLKGGGTGSSRGPFTVFGSKAYIWIASRQCSSGLEEYEKALSGKYVKIHAFSLYTVTSPLGTNKDGIIKLCGVLRTVLVLYWQNSLSASLCVFVLSCWHGIVLPFFFFFCILCECWLQLQWADGSLPRGMERNLFLLAANKEGRSHNDTWQNLTKTGKLTVFWRGDWFSWPLFEPGWPLCCCCHSNTTAQVKKCL